MIGPTGSDVRRALSEPFEKQYGIGVEYMALSGSEAAERIKTEREAGQYLWDIYVSGTTTVLQLKDLGAYDPIESAMLLPEVKDLKSWREGRIYWTDRDRVGVMMQPHATGAPFVNSSLVRVEEFKTWKDFLDPKWKGKIVVGRDPRSSGPGQALFAFFYLHPELGADFIRALGRQELVLIRSDRQAVEWVIQGKYPITFGTGSTELVEMVKQGLPIKAIDPRQLKEGLHVSAGSSNVALMNKAPHPNAAKAYINWLLGKEAQTLYSQATGDPSWRVDVASDHVLPWSLYDPRYIRTDSEEGLAATRGAVAQLLREVFRD
ncbi:MAG TPA: extracellular solute-binding protein [Dehalococcoidia bacterium]|nr:extracellular solute-binding protein [Dehalococcoidia bacterium]